jgi:CBS-domain-containing membrane protein
MKIGDCMKRSVVSIPLNATIGEAVELLTRHHIGTLPVVDEKGKLVGLLQAHDLLSLIMPDFVHLVDHFDFVHNFGAVEKRQPTSAELALPVKKVMEAPVFVEETSGLLRAAALLHHHELRDLPVVDAYQHLVGIASHVDISTALMAHWQTGHS